MKVIKAMKEVKTKDTNLPIVIYGQTPAPSTHKKFLCLKKTYGQPCPICELLKERNLL